jgi:hypothetical protein
MECRDAYLHYLCCAQSVRNEGFPLFESLISETTEQIFNFNLHDYKLN